jgi:signal transduction histidine kinase
MVGQRAADLLVWVAISAPVFLGDDSLPPDSVLSLQAFQLVTVALLGIAVLLAHWYPVVASAVPPFLAVTVTGQFYNEQLVIAQVALAFLLGRRTGGARAVLQLFAVLGAVGLLYALLGRSSTEGWFELASAMLLQIALPWTAGQYARQHAELLRAGWELAERLEREQALVANQVRLRERARIARDMHDSLGHELSLVAVRAAALQVTTGIGTAGAQAAGDLRRAAAAATDRLREIIGMLRDDGDGPPVVPAEDTVQSLVQQARASGVAVTLDDTIADEATPVPEVTARAAYRVVQEALTNATKHAPGAAVTIAIRHNDDIDDPQMVVTVANGAPPSPSPRGDSTRGYGLVGLDERVRLVGGTLDARPTDGGFTVSVRLPLTPAAAPATPVATSTSTHALALARRRLRRSMLGSFWVPAAMAGVLVLVYVLNSGRV